MGNMEIQIKIMSRKEALRYSYLKEIPKTIIVSISSPEQVKPSFYVNNKNIIGIHYMYFHDNDLYAYYGKDCVLPKQEDINGLKIFIDTYKDSVEQIVVHCQAGISRSSATALAICEYLNIENDILTNDNYMPNKLVYKLVKNELK